MKQLDFEKRYSDFWQQFAALLDQLEGVHDKAENFEKRWPELPSDYRKLCQHLSLAQTRQYSPVLTDRLHHLVLRGHKYLYQHKPSVMSSALNFIARDFPRALRADWRYWLIASLLLYVPAVFMGVMCYHDSEFIYAMVGYEDVQRYESMYDNEKGGVGRPPEREADSDFMMFGYYIMNNIGIDFRAYASGILFGIGSVFFMVFNGLHMGGIAGYLTSLGFGDAFWPFVAGHSAPELTAATIAGAAGLKLGYSLINPGGYTRMLSLRKAGRETIPLITGAALMTFLAAFIEGFWSATPGVSNEIKYTLGILGWVAIFMYLLMAGRRV